MLSTVPGAHPEAERVRRDKFLAMGVWGETEAERHSDTLAKRACEQNRVVVGLLESLAQYFRERVASDEQPKDDNTARVQSEPRRETAAVG